MPILCLDFDGVLHSYESGWQGANVVSDGPTPGAVQFLVEATKHFEVHVFSSRSNAQGGVEAMIKALHEWVANSGISYAEGKRVMDALVFPKVKPAAFLTLDDRAICFTGEWPSIETMLAFKPWNKA